MSEGAYIGSEQALSREFGVTGPTLRQAIRLLEHEDLIKVRRGVRGGYYVGRPRIDTVTRTAATYLHGRTTSYDEILEFINFLVPPMVDAVIANSRLEELREFEEPFHDTTMDKFVERQTRFLKLFMDLVDDVPLNFVATIFYQTVNNLPLEQPSDTIESNRAMETLRAEMAQALLRKDRDSAIAANLEANRMVGNSIKAHQTGLPEI
jgi:DNA-binding FadR family transcriptional regulator